MMGQTLLFSTPRLPIDYSKAVPFEQFWQRYPRKVGKRAAELAFARAMRRTTFDHIMAALRNYPWPPDPQYIPYPTTWLNQGRYDDEAPEHIDHVARILGI